MSYHILGRLYTVVNSELDQTYTSAHPFDTLVAGLGGVAFLWKQQIILVLSMKTQNSDWWTTLLTLFILLPTALHLLNSRPIVGGELCDYLGATMLHSPGSFPFWYGRVSQCFNMKSHVFVPDDFGYGHMKHCDRKWLDHFWVYIVGEGKNAIGMGWWASELNVGWRMDGWVIPLRLLYAVLKKRGPRHS